MEEKAIKAIERQTLNSNPKEVDEINLDGIFIDQITNDLRREIERFPQLKILRLNKCGLTNLQNLPNIKSLLRLEIASNNFDVDSLVELYIYPNLISLNFSENNLATDDELAQIAQILPNLEQLEIWHCSIAEGRVALDFRAKVFALFPRLQYLDNLDKYGNVEILSGDSIDSEKLMLGDENEESDAEEGFNNEVNGSTKDNPPEDKMEKRKRLQKNSGEKESVAKGSKNFEDDEKDVSDEESDATESDDEKYFRPKSKILQNNAQTKQKKDKRGKHKK